MNRSPDRRSPFRSGRGVPPAGPTTSDPGGRAGRAARLAGEPGELLADEPLVGELVLAGLPRAPAAGEEEDERQEDELSCERDPPPLLPLLRVVLLLRLRQRPQELHVLGGDRL